LTSRLPAIVLLIVALAGLTDSSGAGSAAVQSARANALVALRTPCLLGGSSGGKWTSDEVVAPVLKGGERYRLYSISGYLGTATGSKPEAYSAPCPYTTGVTVSPAPGSSQDVIAMGGAWAAMPRVPRVLSTGQAVYVSAVGNILRKNGISNPRIRLTRALRIDLEGDGVSEVLISATSYADQGDSQWPTPDAQAGDYSLVLMRKVVRGQVVTTLISGEFHPRSERFVAPSERTIAGVLDANGDGIMEVALRFTYYEGEWTSLYQVKGTTVEEVLTCGCGA
jgi:hypothetical protein